MEQKTIYVIDHDQSLVVILKEKLASLLNCQVLGMRSINEIKSYNSAKPDLLIVKDSCIEEKDFERDNSGLRKAIEEDGLPLVILYQGDNHLTVNGMNDIVVKYLSASEENLVGRLLHAVHEILLNKNEEKEKQIKRQLVVDKAIKIATSITMIAVLVYLFTALA